MDHARASIKAAHNRWGFSIQITASQLNMPNVVSRYLRVTDIFQA
jgi:hypothetical protein